MNRKINIFTLLIFAYSIIVCVTFKKDTNKFQTNAVVNKSFLLLKSDLKNNIKTEKITVSTSSINNQNQ